MASTVRSSSRSARRSAPRTPVDRLRAICLALSETTEKTAWGEPTWRVRGKLFAQLDDHHHGAEHLAVWLPAALGVQELLVKSDPRRFFVPPYVGHRGWIGVRIDGRPNWRLVTTLVHDAYAQAAPKRRPERTPKMPREPDRRPKGLLILAVLFGVLSSAGPALATPGITIPAPSTLILVAVGGGVAGAIALGRNWRRRRDARRRRDG
jgi:hypothetical protein